MSNGPQIVVLPARSREPKAAAVMAHGRGATAADILSLAPLLGGDHTSFFAPQAQGNSWWPESFLAPLARNAPYLDAGLDAIGSALAAAEGAGVPPERILVLGFSQGACLALEYAARHARRYGGVVAFSGGLLGTRDSPGAPPDDKAFDYAGTLAGTPVFLGCSDVDPHIPLRRVDQTAAVFQGLGGVVTQRIYPGMAHTVNNDELRFACELLASLVAGEEG